MTNTPRTVPEVLDNQTLQCLMDEHTNYVKTHNGEGPDIDLSLYIISDFDFSGLNLRGMHAHRTAFYRCRFVGTDLYTADFGYTVAPGTDFREAVLAKAVFNEADLSGANFDGANLIRTTFMDCDLRGATFRSVDFSGGWVSDCILERAVYDPQHFNIIV